MCACIHVCALVYISKHMCVCVLNVCLYVSQIPFLTCGVPYVFEAGSLVGLKLTKQARLAGRLAPGVCLALPPQH